MNDEKRRFSPPAVGGSSLLVIFAVLCLTVFAMLSMSTVLAEQRLRDASADAVSDYYTADVQAETVLARLRAGEVPEGVELSDDLVASYSCPLSDTQSLAVQVVFDGSLGGSYRITRWQVVYTADWTPDNSIKVWSGAES